MTIAADAVTVQLEEGRTAALHRYALRDACPCASCRHPVSGQRLFESHHVLPNARIETAHFDGNVLEVEWSDGHRSTFERAWLAAEARANELGRRPSRRIFVWDAELGSTFEPERYADVVADRAARMRWLGALAEYGFAVLKGCPLESGTVAEVAELFGHIRETNYGRVFDVNVRVDATNLADTSLPLSLHTDNPYRTPAPTLQLLHCLESSAEGGETVLVDGFRAVEQLEPRHLKTLAKTSVRYAYTDETAALEADVPVLELDSEGFPTALHVNNRSKRTPVGPHTTVASWYEAYFALMSILERTDGQVVFRLEPGDVLAFDNLRVLHARTSFSGEGTRRLQGCYADRDALESALAVLARGGAT
jgi:gamma-butyrobetaine dioxygenase